MMKLNEAIDYLQQIADNAELSGYSEALAVALDAMREVDRLHGELTDERYRHDRQCDFTVGQDKVMRELKEENEQLKKLLELARGERDAVTKRMIELEAMNGNT